MTTSLSKSTIPPYDPYNSYYSPRPDPRVKLEGRENYMRNRGSINLGDYSVKSKAPPMPCPKVKNEVAQCSYIKNTQGSIKEVLTGYCENQPIIKKGPRIKKEAQENFIKNKGSFNYILNEYGKNPLNECTQPRVFYEGKYYNEKNRGSVGNLLANYGKHPISARPIPRVNFDGEEILNHNTGAGVKKALNMVPESSRPKSTTFFNFKF